jgi:periplasmic protein TonB
MKNSAAITIGYEDILFFNKNKDYGAYILRRAYRKNLTFALLTAITVFTGAVSYPLYKKSTNLMTTSGRIIEVAWDLKNLNPDAEKNHIPEVPQTTIGSTIKFLPPVVKPDEDVSPTEKVPTQQEMEKVLIGTVTQKGTDTSPDISEIVIPVDKEVPPETKENIFTWVEEMPRYKGDESELYKFFAENIKYPEIAKRAGVEGRVILTFIVSKDGSITNISVLKGIGAGCDEEAVRVLGMMGKWSPGRQNGNPVRVAISIPIVFKLQSQ